MGPLMIAALSRWIRPSTRSRLGHVRVVVYSRVQCCCCHKAIDLLNDYPSRHGFTLETVDVDSDPALVAQYNEYVPVVTVNGKVRFKGVVNPVLFERLLLAERRCS
jgi:glutaredoxin